MEKLVLHEDPISGNCYKIKLTAALLGLRMECRAYSVLHGETRTPQFLNFINPNGRIPVLGSGTGSCRKAVPPASIWQTVPGSFRTIASTAPTCCAGCSSNNIIMNPMSPPCGSGWPLSVKTACQNCRSRLCPEEDRRRCGAEADGRSSGDAELVRGRKHHARRYRALRLHPCRGGGRCVRPVFLSVDLGLAGARCGRTGLCKNVGEV